MNSSSLSRLGVLALAGTALFGAGCWSTSSQPAQPAQVPTPAPTVQPTSTGAIPTPTAPKTTTAPKPTTTKPKTTTNVVPMNGTVTMSNMTFSPMVTAITTGGTVTWINKDTVPHTTKSDAMLWDSGTLQPGKSFSKKFNAPGSYTFHCAIHPNMSGTIVVRDPVK